MDSVYFPGPLFGWIFLLLLLGIMAAASYLDCKALVVPKQLTLPALGAGILLNVLRGLWMGGVGNPVWLLGDNGLWLGGLDGFLFAAAGGLFGFVLFLMLWLLGVCGGGDVKLFAALGAWVGPYLLFWVFIVTILLVGLFVFGRIVFKVLTGHGLEFGREKLQPPLLKGGKKKKGPVRRKALGFSLPLALACLLVLPWAFRVDLHFVPAPANHGPAQTNSR